MKEGHNSHLLLLFNQCAGQVTRRLAEATTHSTPQGHTDTSKQKDTKAYQYTHAHIHKRMLGLPKGCEARSKRGRSMGPCKTAHSAAGPGESGVMSSHTIEPALFPPSPTPGRRLYTESHHYISVAARWLTKTGDRIRPPGNC